MEFECFCDQDEISVFFRCYPCICDMPCLSENFLWFSSFHIYLDWIFYGSISKTDGLLSFGLLSWKELDNYLCPISVSLMTISINSLGSSLFLILDSGVRLSLITTLTDVRYILLSQNNRSFDLLISVFFRMFENHSL